MKIKILIFASLILFLGLIYIQTLYPTREPFHDDKSDLIDPQKLYVIFGNSVPLQESLTINNTSETCVNDTSPPPITLDVKSSRSMFEFAYNKCSPECCKTSGYMCGGKNGCVCMTDDQKKYLNRRGGNRNCKL
jgi:hypothetical protein